MNIFKKIKLTSVVILMLISLNPMTSNAASYNGTVTFVSNGIETPVKFNSPDQTIGGEDSEGHKGDDTDKGGGASKKYFISWSDVDGYVGEKGKGFYGYQPISDVFPNGIPDGAKIYASYLSASSALYFSDKLKGNIEINKEIDASKTMYDHFLVESVERNDEDSYSYYVPNDIKDNMPINLGANFTLNPFINAVAGYSPNHYFQPGTAQYYGAWGDKQTSPSKEAYKEGSETAYTFVDLHVNIDNRIKLNDNLNFQFKSYSFKPLMILDKDYNKVEDASITINKNNPISDISFSPKDSHEFIVRTSLRATSDFENVSYEEANTQDMMLINSKENNFTVSKDDILDIATKKSSPLEIKGYIDGGARLYAKKVFVLTLGGPSPIPKGEAKPIKLNFMFNEVSFNKNTEQFGDSADVQYIGKDNVINGSSIKSDILNKGIKPTRDIIGDSMPDNPADVIKDGVKYKFVEWNTKSDGKGEKFTADTVVKQNIQVYAIYNKVIPNQKHSGKIIGNNSGNKNYNRVNGVDRIETSIQISKKYFNKSNTVIIVRHDLFPDSMTATVLSKQLFAPILLTPTNYLDSRVRDEIIRLGANKVIIVGGERSVSNHVRDQLKEFDNYVERLSGPNRYDTSSAVAKRVVGITGVTNRCVVASGEVFPDALTVSSFAADKGYPILLVRKNEIPDIISNSFLDLKIKDIYVVGGYNTIDMNVEKKLPNVLERMYGNDRYETSVAIARSKFLNSDSSFIASGEVFSDSLVIGPVSGKYKEPILLVRHNNIPVVVENYIKGSKLSNFTVVGGVNTISNSIVGKLKSISN